MTKKFTFFLHRTAPNISLNDVCFQIFEPVLSNRYRHLATSLPSYSCLMLSPANIWRDVGSFQADKDFLSTLLKYRDKATSPLPSGAFHNLIFGVAFDETGIRRTYGRNRQRTITYAITIALRQHSPQFINGLRRFLFERYPYSVSSNHLHRSSTFTNISNNAQHESLITHDGYDNNNDNGDDDYLHHISNETLHIFFKTTFTVKYMIPLALSYLLVCLYIYFSVSEYLLSFFILNEIKI